MLARIGGRHSLEELPDRVVERSRGRVAPIGRHPQAVGDVRAHQPLEVRPLDQLPSGLLRDESVDVAADLQVGRTCDRRHLDGADGGGASLGREGGHIAVGVWALPLVDGLPDDLDVVACPEHGVDRPGLITQNAPMEPTIPDDRTLEDPARRGSVVEEAGVGRDGLATQASGCRGRRRAP